jgi:hypothetical protein
MSKKLIAVASAAALALSALVATPATAAAFSVAAHGENAGGGTTSSDSYTINAPSQDVMRIDEATSNSSTGTLIRFAVVTTAASAGVTVTATGGVRLLTQTQLGTDNEDIEDVKVATGTQSLTLTTDSSATVDFYAYSTSTSAGTVTVTQAGTSNSKVIYVKAISANTNSYKLNFTATASTAAGGDVTFTGTVTDMFGNLMTLANSDLTVDGIGGNLTATITGSALEDFDVNGTTKVHTFTIANRDTTGPAAFLVKLDTPAGKVTAFGSRVDNQFFNVNAVDLSAQVTALTAQVSALQAQLEASRPIATSVTKKRFNTLARKWNAANPGSRVALTK